MFDIDELIAECRQALAETEPRLAIKDVLERAMSAPEEVVRALAADQAEVVPLYVSDDLSVLKAVWAPGMHFRPHNHLMWAAIGIYGGQEDNTFYRRVGSGITRSGGRELCTGDVAVLGDDTIHAIVNPRGAFTGAIHVYGGDITGRPGRSEWDETTFEEVPYDFERVKRTFEEANSQATPATSADAWAATTSSSSRNPSTVRNRLRAPMVTPRRHIASACTDWNPALRATGAKRGQRPFSVLAFRLLGHPKHLDARPGSGAAPSCRAHPEIVTTPTN